MKNSTVIWFFIFQLLLRLGIIILSAWVFYLSRSMHSFWILLSMLLLGGSIKSINKCPKCDYKFNEEDYK